VAAALAAPGGARAQGAGDAEILRYALVLEQLQSAFYTEAQQAGMLRGPAARIAEVVGAVERAHVKALRGALAPNPPAAPAFDFQGVTEQQDAFVRTSVAFEDLAVTAYKGQVGRVRSPEVLAVAASIHSVEARHAAWIRYVAGVPPAADALDGSTTRAETERIVASTGFIVARPQTSGSAEPPFTG
jgi:rubrerythrin